MGLSFDIFTSAFLAKITDFEFLNINLEIRTHIVDGYMKRTLADFRDVCKIDFLGSIDQESRTFGDLEVPSADIYEIQDIVSDGMIVQWLRPYVYQQELLQLTLNTKDFTTYSSANLLGTVNDVYQDARRKYIVACREYSYRHGDLTDLHT